MTLTRLDGWEERLDAAIEAARPNPFALGQHDCARFAASCIDAITGAGLLEQLSAQYHDEESCLRWLATQGSVEAAASSLLGAPASGWACARRGDVCLVPVEGGDGLGVCVGLYIAVAAERGLSLYPLSTATRTWMIG